MSSITVPHQTGAASQGTLIESSRVAAEVYAAILVAQQCPRDLDRVQTDLEHVCGMKSLADRAFFKYPTGGKTVVGPTIRLALELVRIWRNTQWGMVELERTPGRSELLAFAWDVEVNARSSRTVIVEHKRDKSEEGPQDLTDMRAIMANNTSIASRHLRETIWTILPLWLTESAVDLCHQTLSQGGRVPLPQRIKNCVDKFTEMGVRREQLVTKLHGRPAGQWDVIDLSTLTTVYSQISQGQTTIETEFPPVVITAHPATAAAPDTPRNTPDPDPSELDLFTDEELALPLPEELSERVRLLHDLFAEAGIGAAVSDRATRLRALTTILELPQPLTTITDLDVVQVGQVLNVLFRHRAAGTLTEALGTVTQPPEEATT